jgi:hypothetical protein
MAQEYAAPPPPEDPPEPLRDARSEPVPISESDDDFALDDIDTPPILRADRRPY